MQFFSTFDLIVCIGHEVNLSDYLMLLSITQNHKHTTNNNLSTQRKNDTRMQFDNVFFYMLLNSLQSLVTKIYVRKITCSYLKLIAI